MDRLQDDESSQLCLLPDAVLTKILDTLAPRHLASARLSCRLLRQCASVHDLAISLVPFVLGSRVHVMDEQLSSKWVNKNLTEKVC
jgi:hypothetical protein